MEFATPGVRILARFHYFLPALALAAAGGWLGGYGGAAVIYCAHVLFGWAALAALRRGDGALEALRGRVPGQLMVYLGLGLVGGLLLTAPTLMVVRQGGWMAWAAGAVCALVVLVGGIRIWPAPAVILAADDEDIGSNPLQQAGYAVRAALRLTHGQIERTIEGTPLFIALLLLILLPFALVLLGSGPTQAVWWWVLGVALVFFAPLVHGFLVAEVAGLLNELTGRNRRPARPSRAALSLHEAVREGQLDRVRELLASGVDPSAPDEAGTLPLLAAVTAPQRTRAKIVNELVQAGTPLDATDDDGRTALHLAAAENEIDVVEALVNAGASTELRDREGHSPLVAACGNGQWAAAQVLLKLGVPADAAEGTPPIHAAATAPGDEPAGVELLLRHGAAVDARGKLGRTALMGAAMRGNALVVQALLDAGADINAQDHFGNTALMEAARAGANAVLERLAPLQPDTERRDKPGRTALLVAVSSRRASADTIRLLLGMGADPKARNREGRQASELAISAARWPVARALGVKAPAEPSRPAVSQPQPRADEEATRVIDLAVFETADDREWAQRQLKQRSRTELEAATIQMEAVNLPPEAYPDRPAASEPAEAQLQEELPLAESPPATMATTPATTEEVAEAASETHAPELQEQPEQPEQTERAGYETLLTAACGDDLTTMAMVLEHEPNMPEWWLVSAFMNGVAAGRVVAPGWLLEHGLNANAHSETGLSLLSCIVQQAPLNLPVLEDLLRHGARCDDDPALLTWLAGRADAEHGLTAPLGEDEQRRLIQVAGTMIERGANVEASDDRGYRPLHWAALHRPAPFLERLIAAGADVNATSEGGDTPLMLAVQNDRATAIRTLIKAGADPKLVNAAGTSPMVIATERRDKSLSQMLMSGKPSTPVVTEAEPGPADLFQAAADGNLGRIKRLLNRGIDVNTRDERGCTPLLRAAGEGHADVIGTLLAAGADPAIAARNRTTPLGAAVLGGHLEAAKILCDQGVSADQRQQYGITPLMLAAARWHPRMTAALLGFDADPNARDDTDATPLMAAVQNALQSGAIDAGLATIKLLLKAGADPNAANDEGQTPLMLLFGVRARAEQSASEANLVRIGRMLIESGAEIDRQDLTGWSALHATAAHGFRDAAELLMDRGASRRLRDINGLSPVDLAMDNAHDGLVDLFIQRA